MELIEKCLPALDQRNAPVFTEVYRIADSRTASFQTPGHSGGDGLPDELKLLYDCGLFSLDVSICSDVDSLSFPTSFIREGELLLADAYGVQRSFFLVNGTTCGNLAMFLGTLVKNDKVIIPRSVHRSVVSALALSQAQPIWITNDYDELFQIPYPISVRQVEEAINAHPDAKAVFVTSPTTHGLVADIPKIADLTHANNMLLLVDEAWGAHLRFHSQLPVSAVSYADICVQSMHKTLPVLCQGSVLHVNFDRVDSANIEHTLAMLQTTSPSYLLLATMDLGRREVATRGERIFGELIDIASYARRSIADIPGVQVLNADMMPDEYCLDPLNITIDLGDLRISGYAIEQMLSQANGIQIESSSPYSISILIKPGITRSSVALLIDALSSTIAGVERADGVRNRRPFPRPTASPRLKPCEVRNHKQELVPLESSTAKVSGRMVYAYPPGIPLLLPGESITLEHIAYVEYLISKGVEVKGVTENGLISVCSV